MNIPNKIDIGHRSYNINKIDGYVISNERLCYGNIDYEKGIINISNDFSEDSKNCTFLHEVIHGIDDIFFIDLQEEQVEKLARGIYMFMKNNPEIFIK